jgi:ABC-type amino acid transport substrate-binding protein
MAGATAEPMTRRRVFAFVLAGFLGALAASAQAHDIELRGKLVADGKLTFGVALSGRAFAYRLDGALRGFEIDWAREVADSRGLELEAVQLPRGRLVEALAAGEVDLVSSFMLESAVPEGIATLPYLVVGDHMMVLKGNPFRIQGPDDLAGRIVSTTAGTTGEAFAREINRRLIAEGVAPMHIHAFANHRDTHFPVSLGHAAAYFTATRSALVPSLDPDSRVRLVEGAFKARRQVGFALGAGNRDPYDAIEHAIAAKVANGAYDRLRAEHGLPDELSPFR